MATDFTTTSGTKLEAQTSIADMAPLAGGQEHELEVAVTDPGISATDAS